MSKSKEMPNAEFQEIVLGEYGPSINAIKIQIEEDLKPALNQIVNDIIDTYNLLNGRKESENDAYNQLLSAFNDIIMHINSLGQQLERIEKSVNAKDYKIIMRKRTFNEKWLIAIVFVLVTLILAEPFFLLYLLSL